MLVAVLNGGLGTTTIVAELSTAVPSPGNSSTLPLRLLNPLRSGPVRAGRVRSTPVRAGPADDRRTTGCNQALTSSAASRMRDVKAYYRYRGDGRHGNSQSNVLQRTRDVNV